MVIFGTLGLAVPYTPRPLGENDQRKCVFSWRRLGEGTWGHRRQCLKAYCLDKTRMGEMWPVLAPLDALARACPAHPGKRDILASISG